MGSRNLYLAHSLMRYIGKTGAGCQFEHHTQFAPSEWEFCTLQDMDRAVSLLSQGIAEEQVDQTLWNDACQEQDVGTRFYQNTYCCKTCARQMLIGHANDKRLAQSIMALAQANNTALLLVSERSTELPLIVANIPLNIRAADIWPLLQIDLTAR